MDDDVRPENERQLILMVRMLQEIPGVECPEPKGAFYCFPCVEGVLGKTLRGRTPTTTTALAELVLEEAEVAVSPGRGFGEAGEGYLRLALVENEHRLKQAVRQIGRCLRGEKAVG